LLPLAIHPVFKFLASNRCRRFLNFAGRLIKEREKERKREREKERKREREREKERKKEKTNQ
jgi:hypothetical protein